MGFNEDQYRSACASIVDAVLDMFEPETEAFERDPVTRRWSINADDYANLRSLAGAAFRAMERAEADDGDGPLAHPSEDEP